MELKNWEFYIVPTSVINDVCKDGKSISLSRVRKLSPKVEYTNIKTVIDGIIDTED